MASRHPTIGTLVIAVLLGGGGCANTEPGQDVSRAPSPVPVVSGSWTAVPNVNPLDEYLGIDNMPEGPSEADVERGRKTEEYVTRCMTEQGFAHTPRPPEYQSRRTTYSYPEDRNWVATFGYTITTLEEWTAQPEGSDPNETMIAGFSEAQRIAFHDAVKDCDSQAFDAFQPPAPKQDFDKSEFQSLSNDIDVVHKRAEQDTRVAQAAKKWAECMADAQYPGLADPKAAWSDISGQQSYLVAINNPPPPQDPAQGTPGYVPFDPQAFVSVLPQAKSKDELKKLEIGVALADFDCQRSTGYLDTVKRVRIELEQDFVNKHRAELERYRDAQGLGEK